MGIVLGQHCSLKVALELFTLIKLMHFLKVERTRTKLRLVSRLLLKGLGGRGGVFGARLEAQSALRTKKRMQVLHAPVIKAYLLL